MDKIITIIICSLCFLIVLSTGTCCHFYSKYKILKAASELSNKNGEIASKEVEQKLEVQKIETNKILIPKKIKESEISHLTNDFSDEINLELMKYEN